MLGLPRSTELNKQLPKTAIYAKFQMTAADRNRFDGDISKIFIVNEVSAARLNTAPGEKIQSFFVLHVLLKHKEYSEKTIQTLSKLIPQNMVFLLEYDGRARLAAYHARQLQTPWSDPQNLTLDLKGLTMDEVWENVLIQVGGIHLETGNTLEQQILLNEKRDKLEKEIARLEKLARAEKQPKKKFELVQKINDLKEQRNRSK